MSREAIERYPHLIQRYIRNRQGIYALYRRNKLYYVGLASDLKNRLKAHLRDRHGESWDFFSVYLTIGDEHMRELEALLLRISKPSGNKVQGKFARSENLVRKFRRDLHQEHRAEDERLLGGFKAREAKKEKPSRKSKATGKTPVLAKYPHRPKRLRVKFKNWAGLPRARNVRRSGASEALERGGAQRA